MKRFIPFCLVLGLMVSVASVALATTFRVAHPLRVTANLDGQVVFTGHRDDISHIKKLIQFCPDEYKKGCGNNIPLRPVQVTDTSVTFQLDVDAIKDFDQRAFNAKWERDWLSIPDPNVNLGEYLKFEVSAPSPDSEDGRGGSHFTTNIVYGGCPSM